MLSSELHNSVRVVGVADVASLWIGVRSGVDPLARDLVIGAYLPFARVLAAKLYARRTYAELEFMDYFQFASIGLVESVDRFNPEMGVKFETYAAPRINGAVLSGIETLSERQVQVNARQRMINERLVSCPANNFTQAVYLF